MSVTININGENATEVLHELRDLAAGLGGTVTPVQEEKPESKPAKRPTEKKATKPIEDVAEPVKESEDVSTDKATEDVPTVEELRAKAQAVEDKAAVKALIKEFGAKNITTIPEDRRAEFLARLEEL